MTRAGPRRPAARPASGPETAGAFRRRTTRRLREAFAAEGRDGTAELDARLLIAHALGCDPGAVVLIDDSRVATADAARAEGLIGRRIAGEPVARIIGEKEFWSLSLSLSPETLVPRPDTETVVEAALATLDGEGRRQAPLRLLDLGTGSGAILLALLSELPRASGVGIDRAFGAVLTARRNAERLGYGARAGFAVGDWSGAIAGRFDVVVANPPYIASAEIGGLALEVRGHDPHLALDGGADGLGCHRAILGDLGRVLAPGGHGFIEIGAGQADAVLVMAAGRGYAARTFADLAGTARVVALRAAGP